jgi:hypothetical protein
MSSEALRRVALARRMFRRKVAPHPDDGSNMFLRNFGSYKNQRRNVPKDGIILGRLCYEDGKLSCLTRLVPGVAVSAVGLPRSAVRLFVCRPVKIRLV